MTAELALQKALYDRLLSETGVTSLVPATNIRDRSQRPVINPSIIIGEMTARDDGDAISRNRVHVYADLHVWKKEEGTTGVKAVGGAIRAAVKRGRLLLDAGFHCVDAFVSGVRVLRDPDGETAHAVVTVEAIVQEL
ncbi:DUF3168 domain-containing protein [Rhizobium sp. BE258]|uniref:DUF3168 domain-containing protein n=1 Tax=Rhizobium sp. BE258 TaxID=2817722 RepID=UPI00286299A8|nr:DUF3168 domain-containing protein [Rhizobium sp. BE258]MDR7147053.1 hypothetical protein [Rhizobium sp. BE258]